jgi:hypothetical protein
MTHELQPPGPPPRAGTPPPRPPASQARRGEHELLFAESPPELGSRSPRLVYEAGGQGGGVHEAGGRGGGVLTALALAIGISLACSNRTTTPSEPGTHVTDAGMAGCEPLSAVSGACYIVDGAYAVPSTTGCSRSGSAAKGPADSHCNGVTPQTVSAPACSAMTDDEDAGSSADAGSNDAATAEGGANEAGIAEAGAVDAAPAVGLCGAPPGDIANATSEFGATMYGTEGNDDDCKYHVSYETTPLCENDGVYFVVKANYLTRDGAPLTGACAQAEICLNNEHVGPAPTDAIGSEPVVEGPPGTYTIGPVVFDEAGTWTVRFHFNEICCDLVPDSPHGHAAFFVDVP